MAPEITDIRGMRAAARAAGMAESEIEERIVRADMDGPPPGRRCRPCAFSGCQALSFERFCGEHRAIFALAAATLAYLRPEHLTCPGQARLRAKLLALWLEESKGV